VHREGDVGEDPELAEGLREVLDADDVHGPAQL
jgi:hypothetical protein